MQSKIQKLIGNSFTTQRKEYENDRGSALTAVNLHKDKEVHVMKRTNHTLVTISTSHTKTTNGVIITEFVSYVFGGLVPNQFGQLTVRNDLIRIKTRQITGTYKIDINAPV